MFELSLLFILPVHLKMQILYIIVGVLLVWVLVVTVLLVLIWRFFKNLGRDVGHSNLISLLKRIVDIEKKNSEGISELNNIIAEVKKLDKLHFQRMGIVKFNPFEEVGGEHSFSVCLLDANNTGVLLTGLHTRDRTRVYMKEIKNGKPAIELSKEEAKSLKQALT